jgi:hypothetical protein
VPVHDDPAQVRVRVAADLIDPGPGPVQLDEAGLYQVLGRVSVPVSSTASRRCRSPFARTNAVKLFSTPSSPGITPCVGVVLQRCRFGPASAAHATGKLRRRHKVVGSLKDAFVVTGRRRSAQWPLGCAGGGGRRGRGGHRRDLEPRGSRSYRKPGDYVPTDTAPASGE